MGDRENLSSGRRRLAAVGLVVALALVGAGSAAAASPQRIYQDLADNGRLDGVYSRADIERALNPGQVLGTDARTPASRQRSLQRPLTTDPAPAGPDATAKKDGRRVPFSALDVALLIAGGGPLLLIGAGLRRRLAAAPRQAPAASG